MDPPAEAGLENLKFQFLANLDNSLVTFIILATPVSRHNSIQVLLRHPPHSTVLPTTTASSSDLRPRTSANSCPMFLGPTIQRWSLNRLVLRSHGLLFHSLCECVGVCFTGHPCLSHGQCFKAQSPSIPHLQYQSSRSPSCSISTSDSRYSTATARMLSLASILVPPLLFAHSHSSLFSHRVAVHLSLANNSLLQMHSAFGKHHRSRSSHSSHSVSFTNIALPRYLVKPCLSDILAIAIRLVQPSIYLSVTCVPLRYRLTPLLRYPMVSRSPIRQLSLSHPRSLSFCRCSLSSSSAKIHVTNHST